MFSKKQISLKAWIKQKWRTKSGKWSARKAQLSAKKYIRGGSIVEKIDANKVKIKL